MLSNVELAFFFKQLHYLTKRGITLYPAIELIYLDIGSNTLKKPLKLILNSLREGECFSTILYEKIKIPLFIANIIHVGENEGSLSSAFEKASNYLHTKIELQRKVQGALTYPILLVILGFFVISWILLNILPQFKEIYAQAGVLLPLPTRILFKIQYILVNFWWALPALIALSFLALLLIYRQDFKLILAKHLYSIPVFGSFSYYFTLMNFLSNLGSLHNSGVSLIKSLQLTIDTTHNLYFKTKLKTVLTKVLEGEKLSISLWETKLFPAIIIKMIMAGEETAELDKILMQLTDYLHDELDIKLKRAVNLIGPVSLILIGFIIAFIAIAFLLPLFRMSGAIHNAG